MQDKPAYLAFAGRRGLEPIPYADLVAGDSVVGCDWDVMTEIRRVGFHEAVASEEMLLALLAELRAKQTVP